LQLIILNWVAISGWFFVIIIFILLAKAQPMFVTVYDRYHSYSPHTTWDSNLTKKIFYMLIFTFVISISGLFFEKKRYRRKEDKYHLSLVVQAIISFFGILIYFVT